MISDGTKHLVFENNKYELLIDFIKSSNNKIDYQITSQHNFISAENSDSDDSDNKNQLEYEKIILDFFSQENLNKYLIITQKRLIVAETLFLPPYETYLDIKIIPQSDNRAKFILSFYEKHNNIKTSYKPAVKMITAKVNSEALHKSDISKLKLQDLIDINEISKLVTIFHKLYKIPIAIVDLEGNFLTSVGMSEICSKFHRQNEISQQNCIYSDVKLTENLKKDEIRFYKCLNNMYDFASPIYVNEKHIANLFIGQFFFNDEEINYDIFKKQAEELGFDTEQYFAALDKVPRINKETVKLIISFYHDLLNIITTIAHSRLNLINMNHSIEKKEQKLRQITDNMTDVVLTLDFDFNIKYISPSIEKLTGYTSEEYKHLSMENRYPPLAIKEIRETITLELNKDKWITDNNRTDISILAMYNKRKKIVFTSMHSKFLRDENNKAIAIIANISDITKQVKIEKELQKQLKLQYILSTLAVKYINIPTKEIDNSIKESLKQMATFVKADRAYIFEYNWEKQISTLSYEWVAPGTTHPIDIMQNIPLEYLGYLPEEHKLGKAVNIDDFSKLDIYPNILTLTNTQKAQSQVTIPIISQEECFGFVGFDSVKFMKFFKKSDLTLLSIFAQLLVNLTNRVNLENELRDEREKAQNSDELKSNLLINISHEFRTPLNGIIGFSELLQEKSSNVETRNMSNMIYSSAVRLNHVLDSIMLLAQLEDINKKKSICLKTTNISTILFEISSLFKEQFINRGLTFASEIEPDLYGELDRKLVYQALIHLLNNALKFTHKGGVKLLCSSPNNKIVINIIDSGVGIPNESLKIIFAKFRQASEGYNRAYEGVGLGLTIAKKIIDLMQGDIKVKSNLAEGSTFTITLPMSNIDDSANREVEQEIKPMIPKPEQKKPKVLIVEDNTINQKLIISILKKDFLTDLAKNGEIAVILAKKIKYDVILMDIHLGEGIDGLTVTKIVRKNTVNVVTPVIAVTGYTMYGDKERILAEGCNYYLGKPYKKNELLNVLTKALAEH